MTKPHIEKTFLIGENLKLIGNVNGELGQTGKFTRYNGVRYEVISSTDEEKTRDEGPLGRGKVKFIERTLTVKKA